MLSCYKNHKGLGWSGAVAARQQCNRLPIRPTPPKKTKVSHARFVICDFVPQRISRPRLWEFVAAVVCNNASAPWFRHGCAIPQQPTNDLCTHCPTKRANYIISCWAAARHGKFETCFHKILKLWCISSRGVLPQKAPKRFDMNCHRVGITLLGQVVLRWSRKGMREKTVFGNSSSIFVATPCHGLPQQCVVEISSDISLTGLLQKQWQSIVPCQTHR